VMDEPGVDPAWRGELLRELNALCNAIDEDDPASRPAARARLAPLLAHVNGTRTHAITATYGGDAMFASSTSAAINQVVNKNGFQITRTDSQSVSIYAEAEWQEREGRPDRTVIAAPFGQSWRVSLQGIGNVDLAPGASVALMPPTAAGTVLALDGRAYFDIAHRPNSVFSVVTKLIRADDLGTAFDIFSRDTLCTALLVSGSLKVTNGANSVVLRPGNEASVRDAKKNIDVTNVPDINMHLAWRTPAFEFDDLSIPQFMQQVTEWYCLKGVVYDKMVDTVTKRLLGGGHLGKNLTLRELLDLLQYENPTLHFEVRGKYIYVTTILSTSLAIGGWG